MIKSKSTTTTPLTIAFLRAPGGLTHIAAGMRAYCGVTLTEARVVDVAEHEAICPDCAAIMRRLCWLVGGESGGAAGR